VISNTTRVFDITSAALLLVWLLLVIIHLAFRNIISGFYVDTGAWIAFAGSLLLSGLPRWLNETTDKEVIGPFRLWIAASTVALIFCMASSFVATPKLKSLQAQLSIERTSPQQLETLRNNYTKVRNFSMQFLCIRAVLAIGLALGLKRLPQIKGSED